MPSDDYRFDDYTFNDDNDDTNSTSSHFHKVEKVRKNKVLIGNKEDDDNENNYIYNSSNRGGSFIFNAVTGYKTNFLVGTREEDYFFSVIDSSGRDKNKNPLVFFFESPEQYERIMRLNYPKFELSKKTIQNWHKKQMLR